ncbi:DUF4388 domain-containing protein [Oscillatoria laete-virens NRMC-F 0139]|nr:DUF4388 domain-containing protein [Oscillatoria laete-virens]MDL5054852.1 DUF4388 domain-containing protein [Oscillatoria laete-virens NRMC-F 0139]
MFSGSFAQISFGEVLRLLTAAAQSGELQALSSGQMVGSVYLTNGQIADARTPSFSSLDAISELCLHTTADFVFAQGVQAPSQNLLGIPSAKIIETVVGRVNQINLIRSFAPMADEVVAYRPSENISKLDATPDELTLLLLANGQRTVAQIASESGRTLDFVQQSLARFRQAGVIEIVKVFLPPVTPTAPPAPLPAIPQPLPTSYGAVPNQGAAAPAPAQPRYWRGKKIE